MLLAGIPGSLGTPSNLRHETQNTFVQMVGEALDEVEACKLQEVDESRAALMQKLTSPGRR